MAVLTKENIRKIPKTDLHLHLDGSLRLETLIELSKSQNCSLPSYTKEGLIEKVFKPTYKDLGEYLKGFEFTCNVLRDKESLERVSYELAKDSINENVFYIEVRFAPQLHMFKHLTFEEIVCSVNYGLDKAKKEFNAKRGCLPPFEYGIILCAMRMFGKSYSPYFGKLFDIHQYSKPLEIYKMAALELVKGGVKLRDSLGIPIVGVDLAGQEDGHPASDFSMAYKFAHEAFLHKTVHAGEAYGAESIFQAISDLHADRIGHGFYLFDESKISNPKIIDKKNYIDQLASYIADKRVTIEVCLTSNQQTNPHLVNLENHSIGRMLKENMSITICTDNRLVSGTTVTDEIFKAVETFNISKQKLRNIITYGFKRSFYPGPYQEKRDYIRQIIDYYESTLS